MKIADKKRFWSFVNKVEGCWDWQGGINSSGRGTFWLNGKTEKAHRTSFEINRGKIPKGLCVLHRCDNGKCVRPDHLFLGTFKDKTQDMIKKGRHVGRRKISREAEAIIFSIYFSRKIKQKTLAEEFGVNVHTINRIVNKPLCV